MGRPKGGLGKGLGALFADNTAGLAQMPSTLMISEIEPNKEQPRKQFTEGAMQELAESIKLHGVVQPLVVRPMPNGRYQLVAGERRWRASRMAGLTEVPVVIREMTDQEAMAWALIENLQREDLNPMEEALGFAALMEQHGLTQEEVSKQVGKSRPVVGNALRLLQLPEEVQSAVREGRISAGHGRSILGLEDVGLMRSMALEVEEKGLTVRQVEQAVKRHRQEKQHPEAKKPLEYAGSFLSEGASSGTGTASATMKPTTVAPTVPLPIVREEQPSVTEQGRMTEPLRIGPQSREVPIEYEDVGKLPKMRDEEIWKRPLLAESQQVLQELFHRKVNIEGSENRGRICISFYSKEDLINLMRYFV